MNNDDESEFARLVPGVRRLRHDRINVYRERAPASPRTDARQGDVPLSPAAPAMDGPAPASSYFHSGLQKKLQRRIRQGLLRPEASLDLHGCRRDAALAALQRFVDQAAARGLRMLLVVHGQGFRSQQDAVLKPLVQRWLATQPRVLAWCPAQPRDGAAGATYVYLRSL